MTQRTRTALLALALMLVLAATPAAASAKSYGFTVPSGRTICGLLTAKVNGIRAGFYCTSANLRVAGEGIPGVELFHSGKARKTAFGNDQALAIEGDLPTSPRPTLAYGKTWRRSGYTCTSRSTGLTCRRGAHGFFLAREKQRFF